MNTTPYRIHYEYHDMLLAAEIRPCCREDSVVDYAIWEEDELAFTLTRQAATGKWVVALKNADDDITDERVQAIGAVIDRQIAEQSQGS